MYYFVVNATCARVLGVVSLNSTQGAKDIRMSEENNIPKFKSLNGSQFLTELAYSAFKYHTTATLNLANSWHVVCSTFQTHVTEWPKSFCLGKFISHLTTNFYEEFCIHNYEHTWKKFREVVGLLRTFLLSLNYLALRGKWLPTMVYFSFLHCV